MKRIASMTLMLSLGVAAVYGQVSVKMTFSGTSAATAVNLQIPNTTNDEDNFAGTGTFGPFTVRQIRAIDKVPTPPPGSCASNPKDSYLYALERAGGAVFRFQDGSLLNVLFTEGSDCIDLTAGAAHCTVVFQIIGGTGRFQHATGTLTFTESVAPMLCGPAMCGPSPDAIPALFFATGEYTGKIFGVGMGEGSQDTQR
jgi:hypothetical protein